MAGTGSKLVWQTMPLSTFHDISTMMESYIYKKSWMSKLKASIGVLEQEIAELKSCQAKGTELMYSAKLRRFFKTLLKEKLEEMEKANVQIPQLEEELSIMEGMLRRTMIDLNLPTVLKVINKSQLTTIAYLRDWGGHVVRVRIGKKINDADKDQLLHLAGMYSIPLARD